MTSLLACILSFLDETGVDYRLEPIAGTTFLPGLQLQQGTLIIDTEQLAYPGDVLHEAGHLATMPLAIRAGMSDVLDDDLHQGGELMAIAWSYAACVHLGIAPSVVFHDAGYQGSGQSLIDNFESGRYIGVPLLQWSGMCYDEDNAAKHHAKPYPAMLSWTCKRTTEEID